MNFFEQHKALIITSLFCGILLLTMYNINISNSNEKVRETLIELRNLKAEETPKESQKAEEKEEEEPAPARQPNLQTHQAFNQNREESESSTRSRLEEIFKKNAAEQQASENGLTSEGDFYLNKNTRKKQQQSEGNNTSAETSVQRGSLRNSSISFSLKGRQAQDIPNPVYTCDNSGKVVVNITVNQDGAVTSTSLNKASSTSNNECLIEKALEYAAGAIFTRLVGRESQPGTITYYFQD